MSKCYFCEVNEATTTKLGEPSCGICKARRISVLDSRIHQKTEKEKAKWFKMMMKAFDAAFSEDDEDMKKSDVKQRRTHIDM